MASNPIISWQMYGEITETLRGFILDSSKITADGDFSHEIKKKKKNSFSLEEKL